MEEQPQLLPDPTPILTLPPDDPEPILTEAQKEFKHKREKAQKCRVIALDNYGLHPINTNISSLPNSQKKKIIEDVEKLFNDPDEETITKKFNEICNEKIFIDDYTTFPVYKKQIPI